MLRGARRPAGVLELRASLRRGAADPRDVAAAAIERCRETADLNAFISLLDEPAAPPPTGFQELPLGGIPIAVKDCIDVAGLPCTAGTPGLRDWCPAQSAPVVRRLGQAGAVVVGKTNMHEMSVGLTSNNPTFGPVRNPYDPDKIAGGSSGGSAAAVAVGAVPAALGSDTAGSIRIPAALSGCVGFRPTTGRYPAGGVVPLSFTRDTVGAFARDVADLMLVDEAIAGEGGGEAELRGRRIGIPRAWFYEDLDPELAVVVEAALDRLARAGAELVETEVKGLGDLLERISLPLTLFEMPRELALYLAAGRVPVTAPEIVERMAGPVERGLFERQLWGDAVPRAEYAEVVSRHLPALAAAYRDCFARDGLHALAFPTTPLPARRIGEDDTVPLNGRAAKTQEIYARNTQPASVVGLPSISVPVGLTAEGLPVGLCLDADRGRDRALLGLARAFEQLEQ